MPTSTASGHAATSLRYESIAPGDPHQQRVIGVWLRKRVGYPRVRDRGDPGTWALICAGYLGAVR